MKKVNSLLLLFVVLSMVLVTGASAQFAKIAKIDEPTTVEAIASSFTKPGGIVVGPGDYRCFHYGGRQAARTSDGILHVTWEDFGYNDTWYTYSLDTLGLEWAEPRYLIDMIGVTGIDRSFMAKLSVDPTNDDIYISPVYNFPGLNKRTKLIRSTDGGLTWTAPLDIGELIGIPTAEVSWQTMTIGPDRIFHIVFSINNQDILYTRCDLSAADGDADLSNLVFTKANGDVGAEAVSFVPSGVVFQGSIILDRNNDPHIIFSGDGGSDTFGDKTPYHIYYKTAAQAWGPIPPTRLRAELEDCFGMPEMVFGKDNRGYYFMDGSDIGTVWFGTWEPPVNANSATDFGTLNNGLGYEGAVEFSADTYADVIVTVDDNLYLPNADVDDVNDIIYLVCNTNFYELFPGGGGDVVAFKLADATSYAGANPADLGWELHRWITRDGNAPLGDQGCDVIYDPTRTNLDIFWSAAGAPNNEAQYIDGTAVIPAIDAKPQTIDFGLTVDNPINKGETITITGTVKNNGTQSLGPVPVKLVVMNEAGDVLLEKEDTTTPLLAGAETRPLTFGDFTVPTEKEYYNIILTAYYNGDGASYNDAVGAGFFAFPALDEVLHVDDFQAYVNINDDGDHVGYPFPTWSEKESYSQDIEVGGWTVVDSANGEDFDYLNTFMVEDNVVDLDIGAYIRHMNGVRNDTTFPDMPTGTLPQPQNELLYSPVYSLAERDQQYLFLELNTEIDGTDGDDNFPIHATIQLSVDDGATWQTVQSWDKLVGGVAGDISIDDAFYSYNITEMVGEAANVQFRFWWQNPNNTGEFATWWINNVTVIDRGIIDGIKNSTDAVVDKYELSQNYPNPFNPTTDIQFTMPVSGKATLTIFNVTGQQVAKLIDGTVAQGTHTVNFDAHNLPSGVYFYKFQTNGFESVKKMALMK